MQDYEKVYNTYPVFASEGTIEGSFKRYSPFPTPKTVFDYALMGIKKEFPLTKEPITPEMMEPFLESAIGEIEMKTGMNLSEVTHYHSEDYWDGMDTNNFTGIKLQKWPATRIISVRYKYPHTNTVKSYQTWSIPAQWIMLRRNKVNVVVGSGNVTPYTTDSGVPTPGAWGFTSAGAFGRGKWQPGALEVVYTAGFDQDKLPSAVADLVKTWAAHRALLDFFPFLFPHSSVSNAIDGVSQSANFAIQGLITERLKGLEIKKKELLSAIEAAFGRQIKSSFL